MTYTTAHSNTGSLTHRARPGIEPSTLWFLVGFVNHCATTGTPEYRSFVSLGRFIPKYFILFDAMVNGIVSLISLSDLLLLVYRKTRNFCLLILYPEVLLGDYQQRDG